MLPSSSQEANQPYQGSCLCQKVQFRATRFAPEIGHCHCTDCRKFHGAAFSTFVEVPTDNFQWLCGEEFVKQFVADNGSIRQFCSHCGSSLTFTAKHSKEKSIEVALALFDTSPPLQPDAHIFMRSKVPWIDIADKLPCYTANRIAKS